MVRVWLLLIHSLLDKNCCCILQVKSPVLNFVRFAILSDYPYNTIHRTIWSILMNPISANDLKTKGVGAIDKALQDQTEVALTVRGEVKYIVMSNEQYQYLRECELEAALAESKADLDAGRYVKETVSQHLKRISKINRAAK